MTYTDVLDSRIDAAMRTLRSLRRLHGASAPSSASPPAGALRAAERRLTVQIEELAAARAVCHRAPAPRPRTTPLGAITTDQRGVITRADLSIAALLRRTPEELVGTALIGLIALPDRRRFGRRLCELIENPDTGEWQTRLDRSGSLISISVALRVTVLPGSRLLWGVRDLRELRRAQSEGFARQESVRGATRLLRRLARETSRLRLRLPPMGRPDPPAQN